MGVPFFLMQEGDSCRSLTTGTTYDLNSGTTLGPPGHDLHLGRSEADRNVQSRRASAALQRGSGAHTRNGRDAAVDQEVCPDHVRGIVRREVNRQLRDFQRIGHPLAGIVGSEDVLNRLALLFAWKATEHRRVRRAWA